jgi:uncharacterized protein YxeA
MKKILVAVTAMLCMASLSFAQVKKAKAKPAVSTKPATPFVKPAAATKPLPATATSTAKLKKDGTPDMRFKENKKPLKKDGTPDMRFKANKTTPKKKS